MNDLLRTNLSIYFIIFLLSLKVNARLWIIYFPSYIFIKLPVQMSETCFPINFTKLTYRFGDRKYNLCLLSAQLFRLRPLSECLLVRSRLSRGLTFFTLSTSRHESQSNRFYASLRATLACNAPAPAESC